MRVLVEAMCAEFGGIRTYAENLLAVWSEHYPDDELHVIVPVGSDLPTGAHHRHEVRVPRPGQLGRPGAQTRAVRRLVRELQPDAVLATLPSTTVLKPRVPTAVVIYDLRHELLPEQFSAKQRLLRWGSYSRGYAIADGFISISQRSLDDLHALHPATAAKPGVVAHLGADHVATWPTDAAHGRAVAFAHHTNKNIDLVLDGWALLGQRRVDRPGLVVTGVSAAERPRLEQRCAELGLTDTVELARFMPDGEFVRLMAGARAVVFPTSFEGFGLPVVEGMWAQIPVVIGPERATLEIAGGHATVISDWTPEALVDAVDHALDLDPEALVAAAEHARAFTWRRTLTVTRDLLRELSAARK